LRDRYRTDVFSVPHDLLTVDRKKVLDLCSLLCREEFKILWTCFGRIDCMDDEMLGALQKSGCISVGYGVESGSPKVQKAIGKNLSHERTVEVVQKTVDTGMSFVASFITGFPEEDEEDLRMTARLIRDLARIGKTKAHIGCSALIPYGGSRLYEDYRQRLTFAELTPLRSPGTPFDKDSLALLDKRPALFSAFYYIPNDHFPRRLLEEAAEFLVLPLQVAPATTLALWREWEEPWDLFHEWKRFNAGRAFPYETDPHRGDENRRFAVTFLRFAQHLQVAGRSGRPYMADLALHEVLKAVLRNRTTSRGIEAQTVTPLCDDEELQPLRPVMSRAAVLREFSYDAAAAEETILRTGEAPELPPSPCGIAYYTGFPGVVTAHPLGPRALAILRECRGDITTRRLVCRHEAPGEEPVASLLLRWYYSRLITFESRTPS
jgi:hypothetical protein